MTYSSFAPFLPVIVLTILTLVLLLLVWLFPPLAQKLKEALFRNIGVPYRNLVGLSLGITASFLPLTNGTWSPWTATWIFIVLLTMIIVSLVVVRPSIERELDRFAWGLLVVTLLGFGLGALIFQARSWWIWLWQHYLRINNAGAILLESLFLLGVILGFFVVRNWAKEQKDFVSSLSAVLSGAFVATILGKLQEGNPPAVTPMRAFAFYALGFTMSGSLNLIAAARLTADYVNKRSIKSRAIMDFLYGSERAKIIDGYFLRNFEDDPDYAKRFLLESLLRFRKLVKRQFAERMNKRIKHRKPSSPEDQQRLTELCAILNQLRNDERLLLDSNSDQITKEQKDEQLKQIDNQMEQTNKELRALAKAAYWYELHAIECGEKTGNDSGSSIQDMDREYDVVYKRVSSITEDMFRLGIAIRRQDVLEYIVAPGQYLGTFPYFGSVAGLSLIVRQTIVMNRDRTKNFRSKDYRDGICPRDIEQWRGLDEIDYLSYISIPIVSRLGRSTENPLGVVNLDTKLFATHCEIKGTRVEGSDGLFRAKLTPNQLNEYGAELYERDDADIRYIEKLTRIIEPLLELYSKCRVGAP